MTAKKRKRKRSLKRNKKKTRLVASSKRKEKLKKINQTMIRGAHYAKKWGQDLKELYWNKVQQFLDRGKSQTYADNAAFNALLPVWRGSLRKAYLERLKWIHRIKLHTVHRKVMKTLRRFIDDMDFDKAAESAVEKRKFLLNRVVKEKLLPAESDDDEEAEGEVEAPVSYFESTT